MHSVETQSSNLAKKNFLFLSFHSIGIWLQDGTRNTELEELESHICHLDQAGLEDSLEYLEVCKVYLDEIHMTFEDRLNISLSIATEANYFTGKIQISSNLCYQNDF